MAHGATEHAHRRRCLERPRPAAARLTCVCMALVMATTVASCGSTPTPMPATWTPAPVPSIALPRTVAESPLVPTPTSLPGDTYDSGQAATVTESPLQVMVTPTGGPTAVPTLFAICPALAEAAMQTYSVPVYYGYGGDVGVNSLGMATEAAQAVRLLRQWFGPYAGSTCTSSDSLMLGREGGDEVAFLLVGTSGGSDECYPDYWLAYPGSLDSGDADSGAEVAPAGEQVPTGAFGAAWHQIRGDDASALGFATSEVSATEGMVQRFENGSAYYLADTGDVYILFDRYRRITRSGVTETRAWFRLP